jgi:NTE family protein
MPSYYRPVLIGGRAFVDGAIHSATNLDLLHGAGLDLVVVLSPLSSRVAAQRTTLGRIVAGGRRQLSRRLEREAALVRATGTPVLVLEPTVDDLIARGERRRTAERVDALARLAERTVAQQLARPANRVLVDRLRAHQPLHEIA